MSDDLLSREMLRAFSRELEKAAGLGSKALASGGRWAVQNPAASAAIVATPLIGGALAVKGAKKGMKDHSYGALPGTRSSTLSY
jgi:hypothetical protein